jgi:putative membrane protein
MPLARSLTTAALLLSAVAVSVVASGCSKDRSDAARDGTDTSAAYGGGVAADSINDTSRSFGGATPDDRSDTGNALDRSRDDDVVTPRRTRRSSSVRRQTAADTAMGIGPAQPAQPDTSRLDTTAQSGRTDTLRVGQDSAQVMQPGITAQTPRDTSLAAQPAAPSRDTGNVTTPNPALQQDTLYPDTLRPRPDTAQPDTSRVPGDTARPIIPADPNTPGQPKAPGDTTQPSTPADTTQRQNPMTPEQPSNQPTVQNPAQPVPSYPPVTGDTGAAAQPRQAGVTAADSSVNRDDNADDDEPTDGQIVQLLITVNMADSAGGASASTRATNAQVREYARMMVQDHSAANRRLTELARRLNINPDSAFEDIRELREDVDEGARDLASKSGAEFDREYMEMEVNLHRRVLEALDQKLIPQADNAELKTLLQETRQTVQRHLDRATDIQRTLSGDNQ